MRAAAAAAAAALFAALFVFQATRLSTTPLMYDDAYHAAVAKSLALGRGYATHYPADRPFDVDMSVGPSLQVPAAALIALLGNRYWVPGLAAVVAIDLLLVAIVLLLPSRGIVAFILAAAVLTADRDEWILSHWYTFLGDIPSALLLVLAVLLLARDLESAGTPRIAAGLAMGLAVDVKLLAAVGLVPVLLYGLSASRRAGDLRRVLPFIGAALAPALTVQLWQWWTFGSLHAYLAHLDARRSYLMAGDSIAGFFGPWPALVSRARLLPRVSASGASAVEYFGGVLAAAAWGVLVLLLAMRFWQRRGDDPGDRAARIAGALLLAAAAAHVDWWVFFCPTTEINHLMPAFFYVIGAFALSRAVPARRSLALATWLAVAAVALPRLPLLTAYAPSLVQDSRIRDVDEVRTLLIAQRAEGTVHVGCGWWVARDLEYLLPDVGNFRDCLLEESRRTPGAVVLVRNLRFWNWDHNDRVQRFADACEQTTLLRNEHYVVSRCGGVSAGAAP